MFKDPHKNTSIRQYSLNPLLLFPPFAYGDPLSFDEKSAGRPAYRFAVKYGKDAAPAPGKDGRFVIEIQAGGIDGGQTYRPLRYFALGGMDVTVFNGGRQLAAFTVDRHLKLGYDTSSYGALDAINSDVPHFVAPLDEQSDVFRMGAVIPADWLEQAGYDWSQEGRISVTILSIWHGTIRGHGHRVEFPLAARES